jgi:hypothetical protein
VNGDDDFDLEAGDHVHRMTTRSRGSQLSSETVKYTDWMRLGIGR